MTYLYKYTDERGGIVEIKHRTIDRKNGSLPFTEYNGRPVSLIFNAAGLQFKGSGFYATDYKDKK